MTDVPPMPPTEPPVPMTDRQRPKSLRRTENAIRWVVIGAVVLVVYLAGFAYLQQKNAQNARATATTAEREASDTKCFRENLTARAALSERDAALQTLDTASQNRINNALADTIQALNAKPQNPAKSKAAFQNLARVTQAERAVKAKVQAERDADQRARAAHPLKFTC